MLLYRERTKSDAFRPNQQESNQNVLFNTKYDLNLSTTTVTTPTNGETKWESSLRVIIDR